MNDTAFIAQFIETELQRDGVKEEHARRISKRVAETLALLKTASGHE